jgi:hypothetical protein
MKPREQKCSTENKVLRDSENTVSRIFQETNQQYTYNSAQTISMFGGLQPNTYGACAKKTSLEISPPFEENHCRLMPTTQV